jgi:drug/metabolite transporter (DMT)-like permease
MLDKPLLWLYTIGLALLPTIISLETINVSIKLAGPTTTAILGALEPLTAIFFGVLLFHEHLTFRNCEGVILILLGVLTIATRKSKEA